MDWDFLKFNLAITEEVLTEDCPSALLAKVKATILYSFAYICRSLSLYVSHALGEQCHLEVVGSGDAGKGEALSVSPGKERQPHSVPGTP